MRRSSIIIGVVGVLLLGSVSVAQQHVLPWGGAEASRALTIATAPTASPASTVLKRVDVSTPWSPSPAPQAIETATCVGDAARDANDCAPRKWPPQVVPVTVDPWTKPPPAKPTWAPKPGDVLDPWSQATNAEAKAPTPAPATQAAVSPQIPRSAIF